MSCRTITVRVLVAIAGACFPGRAVIAQSCPAPPAPPPDEIDLGDIGIDQTITSDFIPIAADQNVWFRFRLTDAITPASWFNIDTSRSTINTELGLYNEWSYRVGSDDYSGGGITLANSTASALTFGGGSGERLGEDGVGWFGARIDTGWNQDSVTVPGGWRPYLGAGVYHAVVVGYNADFNQDPNPNFDVSTNFTGSGLVRLRLRTGRVPPERWNEYHHGADAGYSPGTAALVEGSGPLTTILGFFNPGERDIYRFRICDPANFTVTATPTLSWGNLYGARLFLLDADGRGVLGVNHTIAGAETTLTVPPGMSLSPGEYYLAVSSNCGGRDGYQAVPYDASCNALWDFSNSATWNMPIPPNGTGQANPMLYSGRQSDCVNNSDYYFVRLSLTGACHLPARPACPVDFDGDGREGLGDFAEFQNCFDGP